MTEAQDDVVPPILITANVDSEEAQLEAKEINKYLLAKSFFDCREFDRCAAVFLPDTLLAGFLATSAKETPNSSMRKGKGKGKERESIADLPPLKTPIKLPKLSQKSLFLALYAKYLSGEKRKDEDSEMVMGPQDGGNNVNKELVTINRALESWFLERTEDGQVRGGQGWLEYL
jgi:anaphase-promoting complex subunit 8